ncbi:MAG: hypothetical protein N3F66_05800 [Spirochaetes bacterium]|nr:hypothetical protein [Spirochaetota bacterium]
MNRKYWNAFILCLLTFLLCMSSTGCDAVRNEEPLKICFIRNGDVWVMDEDGSNEMQLTYSGHDDNPSWSACGRYILFVRNVEGYEEIYLINNDGKNETRLTFTGEDENYFSPTWMPDGSGIVYGRRFTDTYYIGVMNKSGVTIKEFIASGVDSYIIGISVSPDSAKASYIWGASNIVGIMNLVNGVNYANQYGITNCYDITFAPHGEVIVYIDGYNPNIIHCYNLVLANTIDYTLPYILSFNSDLSFSPSGDKIVFVYNFNIYGYDIKTNQTNLIKVNGQQPCFIGKPR